MLTLAAVKGFGPVAQMFELLIPRLTLACIVASVGQTTLSRSQTHAPSENNHVLVARSLQRKGMRSLAIVVALTGCTESDADQLADLKAQTGLSCWKYFSCENGGQSACPGPSTPGRVLRSVASTAASTPRSLDSAAFASRRPRG